MMDASMQQAATKARETRKIMSSGVGESKPFADPQAPPLAIESCHMNGELIGEKFPPETWHLLAYRNTDEGIAEYNQGKAKPDGVGNPLDPFDRILRDGGKEGTASWETPDPLKDTAEPYKRPGFVQRFLGKLRCDQAGLRKWQPVKDKQGDLVRVGANMFLAEMPEELAAKRRAATAEETRQQRQDAHDTMKVNQERFERDSGLALKPGEVLRDSRNPDLVAREGVHVRRGNTEEQL